MKTKTGKIILSIITWLFSALASCIGWGLLGDSSLNFSMRFLSGLSFMLVPTLVLLMILTLFKKE